MSLTVVAWTPFLCMSCAATEIILFLVAWPLRVFGSRDGAMDGETGGEIDSELCIEVDMSSKMGGS